MIRGFIDRSLVDIGVGAVAGVLYWTILQVAIPGTPGISWIGHLGGLVGGVLAAWLVRSSRTPAIAGGWRIGGGSGGTGATGATGPVPGSGVGPGRRTAGRKSVDDMLRELKEKGF